MPFPHPDDIVIDPEAGVRFVGHVNEDEQSNLEDSIRIRDLLPIQDHYDRRVCRLGDLNDPDRGAGGALLFVNALNDSLPQRYRLSIVELALKSDTLRRLTKRELQKLLFQGWRALGHSVRRGATAGSINKGTRLLSALYEALKSAQVNRT